jgi:hypothetical protein
VLDRKIRWLGTIEDPCRYPTAGLTELPLVEADGGQRSVKGYYQLPIGDQDRKLLLPGYCTAAWS